MGNRTRHASFPEPPVSPLVPPLSVRAPTTGHQPRRRGLCQPRRQGCAWRAPWSLPTLPIPTHAAVRWPGLAQARQHGVSVKHVITCGRAPAAHKPTAVAAVNGKTPSLPRQWTSDLLPPPPPRRSALQEGSRRGRKIQSTPRPRPTDRLPTASPSLAKCDSPVSPVRRVDPHVGSGHMAFCPRHECGGGGPTPPRAGARRYSICPQGSRGMILTNVRKNWVSTVQKNCAHCQRTNVCHGSDTGVAPPPADLAWFLL